MTWLDAEEDPSPGGPSPFPAGVVLRPPTADHELGRWAPLDGGDLVAVWKRVDRRGRGDLRVMVHQAETGAAATVYETPDAELDDPWPAVLPEGRVLLAGSRSARVFDPSGAVVAEGTVGDHITHLFSAPSGRIWVSYSDQEIFGGGAMNPGIVRFDADLQPEFSYAGSAREGFIGDCYALALTGEIAWACYYEHWPLVRLDPPQVNTFSWGRPGMSSLAVDGSLLALVGGYREDAHDVVLGSFDLVDGFEPWYRRRLCSPDGGPLPAGTRLCGRDDTIHAVDDGAWLRVRLADLDL